MLHGKSPNRQLYYQRNGNLVCRSEERFIQQQHCCSGELYLQGFYFLDISVYTGGVCAFSAFALKSAQEI